MSQIQFNPSLLTQNLTQQAGLDQTNASVQSTGNRSFQAVLKDSFDEVNRLQDDADKAINALSTGQTDNMADVMTAVQKADLAFKTLLQIRNKLLDAYNEVNAMRI